MRDIEVGRRLFRSGESEYLIDGRVCRLRDIQDLLMDSGVGVKAYAVIEQGKIGQVLGARPMERRQLIEEAAGVTKFKSRRRAAELKIEAARQNLTRVDDIIYEIDSQRSALKRQAAKARRYRQLREDLRRWEKVQIAAASAAVDQVIEETGGRLDAARAREQAAAAHVAELETAHERHRIEQAEADRAATAAREAAHAHELNARKLEQQIEFEKQQVDQLAESAAALAAEGEALAAQRSPLRAELAEKTEASRRCDTERQAAAAKLEAAEAEQATAQAALDGLESDVEEARSAAFSAANSAAVLEHVTQSAAEACERIDADSARLAAESADLDTEAARLAAGREENAAAMERLRAALDGVRAEREDSEARLAAANAARDALAADARTREQELAGVAARAASLEELIASREGYGDAAKLLLTAPGAPFEHMGAVADHLQVDREHERVVEAGLDDLLHALVVRSERDARKALELLAEQGAGRCGFAVAEALEAEAAPAAPPAASLTPFTDLVRVSGPGAAAVKALLARHWLAPSFEAAARAARAGGGTVVTPDGTAFRGAAVIRGGGRPEQRGVLRLRGDLEDLQVRRASAEDEVRRVTEQQAALAAETAAAETALKALQEDERARERELLDAEHRMARCGEDEARLAQRRELVRNEERRAREERAAAAARQDEARESIARLEQEREAAEQRRAEAQERLAAARTALQALGAQAGAARVAHAELAERAAGLETAVRGIEAAAAELDRRAQTCTDDRQRAIDRRKALQASIKEAGTRVDEEVRLLDARRADVRGLDERAAGLRAEMAGQAQQVHAARQALDACRTERSGLEVDRARAEAERGQLEEACREAFQLGLDQVCAEVEQLERDGVIAEDARRLAADDDAAEPAAEPPAGPADAAADARRPATRPCRRHRRPAARAHRAPRRGQHDGCRAVRRAGAAARIPDRPARGPARIHQVDGRGHRTHQHHDAGSLQAGVPGRQRTPAADVLHAVRRRQRHSRSA